MLSFTLMGTRDLTDIEIALAILNLVKASFIDSPREIIVSQ